MACVGNQVRPCDLRLHLMKEISGLQTSLKREPSSQMDASPDAMGESSSSGTARLDKADSFGHCSVRLFAGDMHATGTV
ncbi:hypothetical protein NMG60_11026329 [Bertholletia excelsa]